jgi:hypothetical protein
MSGKEYCKLLKILEGGKVKLKRPQLNKETFRSKEISKNASLSSPLQQKENQLSEIVQVLQPNELSNFKEAQNTLESADIDFEQANNYYEESNYS